MLVRVEDVIIRQKDNVCYFEDDYTKTFAHHKCGKHHKELQPQEIKKREENAC